MEPSINPYAAPLTETEAPLDATTDDLVAIRRKHIGAEASIKSIGSLDYFGSVIMIIAAAGAFFPFPSSAYEFGRAVGSFIVSAGIGAGIFYLGFKTRELNPTARIVQTVFLIPGTLISVITAPGALFWSLVIAYVLWSGKARVVFSEHYRKVVIPATPEIKYRSSIIMWIGLILVVLVFGAIGVAMFATRR